MVGFDNRLQMTPLALAGEAEAVVYLKQAIKSGKHWYIALLEAIGLWVFAEETYNGRTYRYLVGGEAFDWHLLAERLCEAVDSLLPSNEKEALLFNEEPPFKLSIEKFKELIGCSKYHQYLNYFYGITVEEALLLGVYEEVRKERRALGDHNEHHITNKVYRRVYGKAQATLLQCFRCEKNNPQLRVISLTELKEFTYWLFKYRLQDGDKDKIASDTKKALEQLKRQRMRSYCHYQARYTGELIGINDEL
ncbi:hypothetical protein ACFLTP_03095 [Chloroflexota bacterium]